MKVELEQLNQDFDLMPSTQQGTIQSSPALAAEQAPSDEE